MKPARLFLPLFLLVLPSTLVLGQAPAAAAAASQGSASIETQIISYRALADIANQLATQIKADNGTCKPSNATYLLADSSTAFEMDADTSFEAEADALITEYRGNAAFHPFTFADNGQTAAAIATAIKSSATYTNWNFQPTTQSFVTLLTVSLNAESLKLATAQSPGDRPAAQVDVEKTIKNVLDAQHNAGAAQRKEVDPQFDDFRKTLTATSIDGTMFTSIVKGRALHKSLGTNFCSLTFSLDAAGGDSKVTHVALYELFFPTPAPSYNGGAAVSYQLSDQNGAFVDGNMLLKTYKFTKLKSSKLASSDRSATSLCTAVGGTNPPCAAAIK